MDGEYPVITSTNQDTTSIRTDVKDLKGILDKSFGFVTRRAIVYGKYVMICVYFEIGLCGLQKTCVLFGPPSCICEPKKKLCVGGESTSLTVLI